MTQVNKSRHFRVLEPLNIADITQAPFGRPAANNDPLNIIISQVSGVPYVGESYKLCGGGLMEVARRLLVLGRGRGRGPGVQHLIRS